MRTHLIGSERGDVVGHLVSVYLWHKVRRDGAYVEQSQRDLVGGVAIVTARGTVGQG